jgi:hypothetical protein
MAPPKPTTFEMLSPADFGATSSTPETISMVWQCKFASIYSPLIFIFAMFRPRRALNPSVDGQRR